MSQGANENLKWKQENFMKRGEIFIFIIFIFFNIVMLIL